MTDVQYREARDSDLEFICSSWVSSYRDSHSAGIMSISPLHMSCTCGNAHDISYEHVMRLTVLNILNRDGVKVWVACDPAAVEPLDLFGWLAIERDYSVPYYEAPTYELRLRPCPQPLVHYCYVKKSYRMLGFARGMAEAAGFNHREPFNFTCRTQFSSALEKHGKLRGGKWNPLICRHEKRKRT